ncbi:PREDICTED: cysteine-rich receptor-like protein kinase 42 [Nelumbo nucifera]|uniref:Cysteine-rich receptor-like protein kinase 42 n=2 Tax=Nelumbo nucifera TaxID=4432 RepID=A0A1U7ZC75_NELNU|nr:PREDICTED: cysteine-rich receptor-like protein kinase 42 [Nelumbo nucifera]DAD34526.1 TPA_asm: hypothetical protein HUJ06_005166 [Nelumbo nucifera]
MLRHLIVFFFALSFFFSPSLSDPRISRAALLCGSSRSQTGTNFVPIFVKEMEGLAQRVNVQRWGTQTTSSSPSSNSPSIYGLAQCHGDLSLTDCLLCFAESRTKLPSCLPANSGRMFLDGCFLRYDTYNFYNESLDPQHDKVVCGSTDGGILKNDMKLEFANKVGQAIINVTDIALLNDGFGVTEVKNRIFSVYALAQCWKTLSKNGCRQCLQKGGSAIRGCAPASQGRALNAGCYLRYSTEKFYNDFSEMHTAGSADTGLIVAITLAAIALSVLILFGSWVGYRRILKSRKEKSNLGRFASTVNKSNLNFKYETLEVATDFFNLSNKIGQGGAGSVFKGTLPDGRVIAVKRLFFNTRQWVDEFFNEVNLIGGIQHKNLVKLLGCSIEGPESLLVYEFVPNKSLDQILFDDNQTQMISWRQRFNIIVGIAEGLAYLHQGSQTRIIHRDIKSSNILLDENLTAKIADFGLARCFGADKTHISTGIAGTLGYMAPEYLVRGQLTEKADVYSFGVLVLEIVCGRKNTIFVQETGSVLQRVWKHFQSNTLPECVDPCLKDDFPVKEASDVLQIGLLCTQASVSLRPFMPDVVQMLTDKSVSIPLPRQPPFLNSTIMDPTTSIKSFILPTSSSDESTTFKAYEPR